MKKTKTVDEYIADAEQWGAELSRLREIINRTELEETLKWGAPVYTLDGKNVVGLGGFKSYFGLWFFQGVFLEDPAGKLVSAQEGRTRGLRQWRMNSAAEIEEKLVRQYLEEAIANQKEGRAIKPAAGRPLELPEELAAKLSEDAALRKAFENFTPGRQKEFAEHVAAAKRPETRARRLEKILPLIREHVGLHDKYKR